MDFKEKKYIYLTDLPIYNSPKWQKLLLPY
jgi:hypothetical protein